MNTQVEVQGVGPFRRQSRYMWTLGRIKLELFPELQKGIAGVGMEDLLDLASERHRVAGQPGQAVRFRQKLAFLPGWDASPLRRVGVETGREKLSCAASPASWPARQRSGRCLRSRTS